MTKEAVITIADLHTNSTLALLKPGMTRDDGEPVQLNIIQKWLWMSWELCLDSIEKLTTGYHKNLVLVGDLGDIDNGNRSWQYVTRNPSTVTTYTIELLEPVVAKCDTTFVIRGTEAHVGKSAWLEEEIAKDLDAEPDPERGTSSWWHLRALFGGVKFDIAHHHSMGNLPWTYANAANKLAVETMYEYMEWGEKPPDIVSRGHQHRFADSGRTYPTRGVFLPAWQFKTSYLHRIGKSNARPHIGAVVFLCDDGQYTMHDLRYKPIRGKPWSKKQTTSK